MTTKPTLRASLRALPRTAWILYAGTFINRFGSFVVVFLTLYLTRRGYSIAQAGLAVGAYGLGNLVASALGGYLADRMGRRNTIVLSMFSAAAALMALSQARSYGLILFLTVMCGVTAELYRPASSALLADLVPAGERVTAFAVYRLAINAGVAAGPATAGLLAEKSFDYIFAGDALTSVLFGIIALVALPQGFRAGGEAETTVESERLEPRLTFWQAIVKDRRFLIFLLASIVITLVFFQFETTFPIHVLANGLSITAYGLLISLNGLIIVLLELPLTTLTQRFEPRPVISLGFLLVGIGFAMNAWSHQFVTMALAVVVWTFGEMISSPVASAYVADLAPAHLRGRYMGTWGLTWSLGLMIGPSLGALAFARDPFALWIACGVLGVLSAALVMIDV